MVEAAYLNSTHPQYPSPLRVLCVRHSPCQPRRVGLFLTQRTQRTQRLG